MGRKATISCYGDPMVGIPGHMIEIDIGFVFDGDELIREDTRELLRECFSRLWDDSSTWVDFDDEEYRRAR